MRTQGLLFRALVRLATVAACGCATRHEPPTPLPMTAYFAGCAEVHAGPICALRAEPGQRRLRLWLEVEPRAQVTVLVDGQAAVVTEPALRGGGGRALDVAVPRGAGQLLVVAMHEARSARFALQIAEPLVCEAVEAAEAKRRAGELEGALEASRAALAAPGVCGARARGLEARLLLDLDRPGEAVAAFEQAISGDRGDVDRSGRIGDVFAMSYALETRLRDFDRARRALESLEPSRSTNHDLEGYLPYYRGLLALDVGDLRQAMRDLEVSYVWAERLGLVRLRLGVAQGRAELLGLLGRHGEAASLLLEIAQQEQGLSDCDRADALNTVGWVLIRAGVGSSDNGARARRALEQSLALYREACPRPLMEANTLVNLALLELFGSHTAAAERWIDEANARRSSFDDFVAEWMLDASGRLALAQGRGKEAARLFEALSSRAPALSEPRWRAILGLAQALEAEGKKAAAIEAYRDAENLLDEQLRLVPMSEGRGGFAADRSLGARRLLSLLLDSGKDEEAFGVARRSAGRVAWAASGLERIGRLSPQQKVSWERHIGELRTARSALAALATRRREAAQDELSSIATAVSEQEALARVALDAAYAVLGDRLRRLEAPPLGDSEAMLLLHPLEQGRFVGFLQTSAALVARRLESPQVPGDPVAQAAALLEPFAKELAGVKELKLVAGSELSSVDFHALPWKRGVLLDAMAVSYSLDLAPRPVAPPVRLAAVIADPTSTLASAPREAASVAQHLAALLGSGSTRTLSGESVDRTAFLEVLSSVDVVHFTGHGVLAGTEGFSSAVMLAGSDRFEVGDVLSLSRAPHLVVLAACETGAVAETPGGLGLAQAFVLAGASAVVGATRQTRDEEAAALTKVLYKNRGMFIQANHALRLAQIELKSACPSCDWAAFRTFVP